MGKRMLLQATAPDNFGDVSSVPLPGICLTTKKLVFNVTFTETMSLLVEKGGIFTKGKPPGDIQ